MISVSRLWLRAFSKCVDRSWCLNSLALVLLIAFSAALAGCSGKADSSLFASECENDNPNCQSPIVSLSTAGAKTELAPTVIANGGSAAAVSVKAIRKGEKSAVVFAVKNTRLAPLRNYSVSLVPGTGFTIETDAADDCSKRFLLVYGQTCTATFSYTPGTPPPDQTVSFKFTTLLGDPVEFTSGLKDAKVLSDFYLTGNATFEDDLVYDATSTGYVERDFTVSNDGSLDDISSMAFGMSGSPNGDFTIVAGGAGACTQGQTLTANGGNCKVKVRYRPTRTGLQTALLSFSGQGGYFRSYELSGMVHGLEATPSSASFASQQISGPAVTKVIQIQNPVTPASTQAVSCSYSLSGDSAFAISANTCGPTIASGATCDITVRFTPAAASSFHSGHVKAACDDRGGTVEIEITAMSGDGPLTTSAASINFGEVLVGESATQTLTLSNVNGTDPLTNFSQTLSGLAGSGISIDSSTCGATLGINQSCSLTLKFAPTAGGTATSSLSGTSDQDSLDSNVFMTGQGITPEASQPSVDLGSLLPGDDRIGQEITITNPSKTSTMSGCSVDETAAGAQGFTIDDTSTCLTTTSLAPGEACTIRPRLTGANPPGVKTGSVAYTCSIGGTEEVALSGIVVSDSRLVIQPPTSLIFSDRLVGITATGSITIANAHASATANSISVTASPSAPWSRVSAGASDCANSTNLTAGASCEVALQYHPLATYGSEQTGTTNGTVAVSADSGLIDPADPSYQGFAKKILGSPASADFGAVMTGGDSTLLFLTVQNPSMVDTASGCSTSISSPFIFQGSTCGLSLAPGATCMLGVRVPSQNSTATLSGTASMQCSVGGRAQFALTASIYSPPLLAWTGTSTFGNVDIGQSVDRTLTLANNGVSGDSPTSTLLVLMDVSSSPQFSLMSHNCPLALAPGQSCSAVVRFTPVSAGAASATIRATDTSGSASLALSGTGVDTSQRVVLSSSSVSITSRLVGATVTQNITLTNSAASGDTTGLTVGSPSTGAPWTLGTSPSPCSSTLTNGSTCQVQLVYQPTTSGTTSGTVTITGSNLNPSKTITYSGTATQIAPNRSTLAFGAVDISTAKIHPVTLKISNPSSVDTATGCNLTVDSPFQIEAGSTCGATLATGASCAFKVSLPAQASAQSFTGQARMACAVGGTASIDLSAQVADIPNLTWNLAAGTDFGDIDLDAGGVSKTYTLTNNESFSVTLSSLGFPESSSGFAVNSTGTTCTSATTLSPGGTCNVVLKFDPSTDTYATGGESAIFAAGVSSPLAASYDFGINGVGSNVSLSLSPTSLAFTARQVGQAGSQTKSSTLTNNGSRTANLTYSALSAPFTLGGTCGATLNAGDSCTIDATGAADTSASTASQTLTVTDTHNGATKNTSLALSLQTYAAPVLNVKDDRAQTTYAASITTTDITGNPDDANNIANLSPSTQTATFTLKNNAAGASTLNTITINLAHKSGQTGTMTLVSDGCTNQSLAANATCSFGVQYQPTAISQTSTYEVSVSSTNAVTGGTATTGVTNVVGNSIKAAVFTLTPSATIDEFGTIEASTTSQSNTYTLSNTGDQTATSLSISFSGGDSTKFSNDTGVGSACGSSLAPGGTCAVRLTFSPSGSMGVFSSTLTIAATRAPTSLTRTVKAASYAEEMIANDNDGKETDITADSTRYYVVSRRLASATPTYSPLLSICAKNSKKLPDSANCGYTDLGEKITGATSNNMAGDFNGSGPRVVEQGNKLIVAISNKEPGATAGGETVNGTATLIICEKPSAGVYTVTDCARFVVNSAASSGQFPSIVVTSTKIALANSSGANHNLILSVCNFDPTAATSAAVSGCAIETFPSADQGWYPSVSFSGSQIVAASFDKYAGLRLTACTVSASDNTMSGCASSVVDTSFYFDGVTNQYTGSYPSLVMSGSKAYVAHQFAESSLSALKLSTCTINASTNAISGCANQDVISGTPVGALPRLALSSNYLWMTAVQWPTATGKTGSNKLNVFKCALPVTSTSCTGLTAHVVQTASKGKGPIFSHSTYLDATNRVLVAPFEAAYNSANKKIGLFQLGLLPEF